MKKVLFLFAAMCAAQCFGIAASQAWVENYVSNYVAAAAASVQAGTTVVQSNGCTFITANGGTANEMRLVVEDFSDAALLATNCLAQAVSAGVTNGCTFVWNGAGAYVNPLGVISCTATNLVWGGVASFPTNGVDRFEGWFDVTGAKLQPDASFAITNGMTEVIR